MTTYLPREITPRLLQAMRRLPVVVLSGLRQNNPGPEVCRLHCSIAHPVVLR